MPRRAIRSSWYVVAAAMIVLAPAAYAQPQATDQPAAAEASGPAAAENSHAADTSQAAQAAMAAFEKSFADFRNAFRQIEQLRIKHQTAQPAEREKINAELTGHLAHTQALANAMIQSALDAYRLAPGGDQRVTDLLISAARYYTIGQEDPRRRGQIDGGDQFEKALPIINALAEGGGANRDVYTWGFLAAFATGDYDLAESYAQRAREAPATDVTPRDEDPAYQNMMKLLTTFSSTIEQYRQLGKKESEIRAAEAKADDLPRVKLTTTKGEITLELFENEAPQAVANFLTLVKDGFYTNSPFHRVLPGFMAQGGAKTDDGQGGPGYTIRCECYQPNARSHFRGSLSMAHAGRDTGNSQFFLTFVPTPHLDGRHTVFGRVIDGIEVLGDIQRRDPEQPNLPAPDRILKAEVVRDRGHEYAFEKLPER